MRIVALKYLPQGQPPGALVDVPDAAGDLFLAIGAARLATEADDPAPEQRRRRPYRRRDLQAEA